MNKNRNAKKHILLPTALVLYALVMAVIGYPHYQKTGRPEGFWLIMAGCLLIAVLLFFVLKKKQDIRNKNRKNRGN